MKELKNIKRINRLLIICLLIALITFSSCKSDAPSYTSKHEVTDYTNFPTDFKGILKNKKVYLTSIGQSSDMIDYKELILDSLNINDVEKDPFLLANNIEEESVVLLFVGCSIKALAESEMTIDEEIDRSYEFARKAKQEKITLICFHIGGEKRRGATSDQFIEILFKNSDFNIFLDHSDNDGFLSKITRENNIPAYKISSFQMLDEVTKKLYGIEAV